MMAMKNTNKITKIKTHLGKHNVTMLNLRRVFVYIDDRQGPSMGILPGAANSQATVLDTVPVDDAVATDVQCVLPHHIGGCSCREPTPEIDNRLQEVGGNPAPATKTRTHTASTHKTYFKGKRSSPRRGS